MNKIKRIGWYVFIAFILVIVVVISRLFGKLIGQSCWIILTGDLIYFFFLWLFFVSITKKEFKVQKRLALLIFILVDILSIATIGLSFIIDPIIILNILVMFLGSFLVLVLSLSIGSNGK